MGSWGVYVPVRNRIAQAKKKMQMLQKKGQKIEPICIEGRKIAHKFWGIKWCEHLESFADYANRLPRGRTYVRNGSVCHLRVQESICEAFVSGSSVYTVTVNITKLGQDKWRAIKDRCSGKIGSMLELLQGKLSTHVMQVVADHREGLFPRANEIQYTCSCPDWAGMCKHVAAVLYGIGSRLDQQPELLFTLRGVNPSELVSTQLNLETTTATDQIDASDLGALFGIDLEIPSHTPTSATQATEEGPIASKKKPNRKAQNKNTSIFDENTVTGKELFAFREKLGLTAAELSQKISVTTSTIYRWENTPGTIKLHERYLRALQKLEKSWEMKR